MDVTARSSLPPAAPKRRDARRSYDALVAAARAAFEEHGLEASLDDIARAAGVGNATLYRHFPTRYELLAVAHAESITSLCERAEQLRETLPGSDALHRWLEDVVDEASGSRGLTAAWKAACSRADLGMEWCKQALADACSSLLTEARLAGAAPAGMTVEEVMQLVTAIVLATETGPSSSGSARRLLAVVIAGLKSNGAHIDTAKPPTRASSRKGQPQDPLTLTGHPSRRQRGTAGRRPK